MNWVSFGEGTHKLMMMFIELNIDAIQSNLGRAIETMVSYWMGQKTILNKRESQAIAMKVQNNIRDSGLHTHEDNKFVGTDCEPPCQYWV